MPCFHPDLDKKTNLLKCKRCGLELPSGGDFAVCPESGFTLPCVSQCNQTHQRDMQGEKV